jgi:hypothetical protein
MGSSGGGYLTDMEGVMTRGTVRPVGAYFVRAYPKRAVRAIERRIVFMHPNSTPMGRNVKFNLTDIAFPPDSPNSLPSYPIIPIAGQGIG